MKLLRMLVLLAAGCGSGPAPVQGPAPTAAVAAQAPDDSAMVCIDPEDELRVVELSGRTETGWFEVRNGQTGIGGEFEVRGSTLVFWPEAGKNWTEYTGLETKELPLGKEFSTLGTFACRKL